MIGAGIAGQTAVEVDRSPTVDGRAGVARSVVIRTGVAGHARLVRLLTRRAHVEHHQARVHDRRARPTRAVSTRDSVLVVLGTGRPACLHFTVMTTMVVSGEIFR